MTSVLLVPSVQGTTPAFLFAFASLPLTMILSPHKVGRVFLYTLLIFGSVMLLSATSQFSLLLVPNLNISTLQLVNNDSVQLILRSSLFTQSLYLVPGVLTFAFVATFYQPTWDRFLFWGASLLALYGLYEFIFFLVTGQNGDFLSNRIFDGGLYTSQGSLFQISNIGTLQVMRLKSLTGEPSMYAFTILPFWIHAIHRRKTVVHLLLLTTLILTTSTTAILGVALYLLLRFGYSKPLRRLISGFADRYLFWFLVLGVAGTIVAWPIVQRVLAEAVVAKLSLINDSGATRSTLFINSIKFYADAPLLNQLFGIGFGYIRSTDFSSTLLVNTGIVGFSLFTLLFARPILSLNNDYVSVGLKIALIIIYSTMMIAVPEFAYLPIWLFLGVAYRTLRQQRFRQQRLSS